MPLKFNGTEIGSDITFNGASLQNIKLGNNDVWSARTAITSLPGYCYTNATTIQFLVKNNVLYACGLYDGTHSIYKYDTSSKQWIKCISLNDYKLYQAKYFILENKINVFSSANDDMGSANATNAKWYYYDEDNNELMERVSNTNFPTFTWTHPTSGSTETGHAIPRNSYIYVCDNDDVLIIGCPSSYNTNFTGLGYIAKKSTNYTTFKKITIDGGYYFQNSLSRTFETIIRKNSNEIYILGGLYSEGGNVRPDIYSLIHDGSHNATLVSGYTMPFSNYSASKRDIFVSACIYNNKVYALLLNRTNNYSPFLELYVSNNIGNFTWTKVAKIILKSSHFIFNPNISNLCVYKNEILFNIRYAQKGRYDSDYDYQENKYVVSYNGKTFLCDDQSMSSFDITYY